MSCPKKSPSKSQQTFGITWRNANSLISPPKPILEDIPRPIRLPSTALVIALLVLDGIDGYNNSNNTTRTNASTLVYSLSVFIVGIVYGFIWYKQIKSRWLQIKSTLRFSSSPKAKNAPVPATTTSSTDYDVLSSNDTDDMAQENDKDTSQCLPCSSYPCFRRESETEAEGR